MPSRKARHGTRISGIRDRGRCGSRARAGGAAGCPALRLAAAAALRRRAASRRCCAAALLRSALRCRSCRFLRALKVGPGHAGVRQAARFWQFAHVQVSRGAASRVRLRRRLDVALVTQVWVMPRGFPQVPQIRPPLSLNPMGLDSLRLGALSRTRITAGHGRWAVTHPCCWP